MYGRGIRAVFLLFILFGINVDVSVGQCDVTLLEEGELSEAAGGTPDLPGSETTWWTSAPPGHTVSLRFDALMLDPVSLLLVYDGSPLLASSLAAVYTGSDVPDVYHTTGRDLTVVLITGENVTDTEFTAHVQYVETDPGVCTTVDVSDSLVMTSPDYPDDYADNLDLCWRVNCVDVSHTLEYTVTTACTELDQDYVLLYDYTDYAIENPLVNITGCDITSSALTGSLTGGSAYLRLTSDYSITDQGFNVTWECVAPTTLEPTTEPPTTLEVTTDQTPEASSETMTTTESEPLPTTDVLALQTTDEPRASTAAATDSGNVVVGGNTAEVVGITTGGDATTENQNNDVTTTTSSTTTTTTTTTTTASTRRATNRATPRSTTPATQPTVTSSMYNHDITLPPIDSTSTSRGLTMTTWILIGGSGGVVVMCIVIAVLIGVLKSHSTAPSSGAGGYTKPLTARSIQVKPMA